MSDIIRVLRVIEYVGERSVVEHTLALNSIPSNGEKKISENLTIKSRLLGDVFEKIVVEE